MPFQCIPEITTITNFGQKNAAMFFTISLHLDTTRLKHLIPQLSTPIPNGPITICTKVGAKIVDTYCKIWS